MSRLGPRDRVDLGIPLRESERTFFEQSKANLEEQGGLLEHSVSFSGNYLYINSVDLISLLSYAEITTLSELEFRALLRKLDRVLSSFELNATSATSRSHYIWCKTALKSFQWGRNLIKDEET